MRTYELVLVLKSSVKEADRKKLLEQVKGWLDKVKVTKEDDWGQKALAYPIKKEDSGHYYQLQLEGELVPADFETRVIQNNDVLRHLLLRTK
jgi:small subunit ribosomal protein S6